MLVAYGWLYSEQVPLCFLNIMAESVDQLLSFGNMDESWVPLRPTSTPVSTHQQFDPLLEHPLPLNVPSSFDALLQIEREKMDFEMKTLHMKLNAEQHQRELEQQQ